LPQYGASADFDSFLQIHTLSQQVNVIVIDQFQELFTQSSAQPRDALFDLLTQLPPFRLTRTHIIATVRTDLDAAGMFPRNVSREKIPSSSGC